MPGGGSTSFSQTIRELWELLRAYARQETVEPLRNLGAYLGFGLAAATVTSLGLGLLLLGGLRLMQAEAPRWVDATARSSFIPYLVVTVLCVLLIGLLASRIRREFGARQ